MVHENARRGQVAYGRTTTTQTPARKRLAGARTDTTDDKGRPVMPFDEFVTARAIVEPTSVGSVMGLMELAFGGR
jgi:hypothetical protein